ncbi:uncharacterized protein C17orf98-like [Acipenser ruthenus]|uniref:uncharacterized protein C17orf98-like n=1 Tax=Acipenser ruthenus TaxID=7906 RepID=UPI00274039D1|nr:uncharacterized protein C17orf98-like [Acipenser ruthenus]
MQLGRYTMQRACVPAGSPLRGKHYFEEKNFILDCVAVSSMARVYESAHPKLWAVIPPYNGQSDNHTRQYYSSPSVKLLLEKTGQGGGGTSIHGPMVDYFHKLGPGQQALDRRNMAGAGGDIYCSPFATDQRFSNSLFRLVFKPLTCCIVVHIVFIVVLLFAFTVTYLNMDLAIVCTGHSDEQVTGHSSLALVHKNNFGYNGKFGYRRNTPFLRQKASCFGAVTKPPM